MNISLKSYIFIFFIIVSSCKSQDIKAKVVSVIDGDTFIARFNNQLLKIRLSGIDSPELTQFFGDSARDFLSSWIALKEVYLRRTDIDKYGRDVCEVRFHKDGSTVNQMLLLRGYAWAYNKYSSQTMLHAMYSARKDKQGMWKYPNNIPPFKFRKR